MEEWRSGGVEEWRRVNKWQGQQKNAYNEGAQAITYLNNALLNSSRRTLSSIHRALTGAGFASAHSGLQKK
jgi:hypothetical protein